MRRKIPAGRFFETIYTNFKKSDKTEGNTLTETGKETAMGKNRVLMRACTTKKDGFYIQYEDIAKEVPHYAAAFRGKRVLCNCDDPAWSQFCEYPDGHPL